MSELSSRLIWCVSVLISDIETNRKCPRWAEFNTPGRPPSPTLGPGRAMSPPISPSVGVPSSVMMPPPSVPPLAAGTSSIPQFRSTSLVNAPPVPSPLATSPPVSGFNPADVPPSPVGSFSNPGPSSPTVAVSQTAGGRTKLKLKFGSATSPPA
jgi:transcription initiation factor TFIID subunit 1